MNHQKFAGVILLFGICVFGYVVSIATADPVGCIDGDVSNLPGIRVGKTEIIASYDAPDVVPVPSVELSEVVIVGSTGVVGPAAARVRPSVDRKLPEHGVRAPFMQSVRSKVGREDHRWNRGSSGEVFVIE